MEYLLPGVNFTAGITNTNTHTHMQFSTFMHTETERQTHTLSPSEILSITVMYLSKFALDLHLPWWSALTFMDANLQPL